MSRKIQLGPQTLLTWLLLAVAFAPSCERHSAKSEEKRIYAEIKRIAEESHQRITSDESRSRLIRLNDLRQFFPDRRDEISKEAEALKAQFIREMDDDRKIADLYGQLLTLPLSETYRNCVTAQKEMMELIGLRSQKIVEEMDVLLDRSVNDRPAMEARVNPIRLTSDEIGQRLDDRESRQSFLYLCGQSHNSSGGLREAWRVGAE